MLPRHAQLLIEEALSRQAAVAVIGSRQVGKTTLALEIARNRSAIYLDEALRGVIDTGRRSGHRTGRFLILGSASIDLLRQFGETLAGRIEYVDLTPLCATEIDGDDAPRQLWVRGGFPDSYLAANDADSLRIRQSFIQGTLLNASRLANSLAVSAPTVTNYIGLLVDLLLVRRLPPFHANVKKRLVKSPKPISATAD